jgi:heme/copper-type cytochrome/quinol oxidase subunit 2
MTDMQFTLSVKENATGAVKTYLQDPAQPSGQFDTTGFAAPTSGPGAPTATPTPTSSAKQTIEINVERYAFSPGTSSPIQVTAGVATTLVFSSVDVTHGFSGIPALGIAGSSTISPGIEGDPYYGGGTSPKPYQVTFAAPLSERGKSYSFSCSANPECGTGHTGMVGVLHVN